MEGICPECGSTVDIVRDADFETNGLSHYFPNKKLVQVVTQYKIPFVCSTCSGLKFPLKALKDIVFIWPEVILEKQGLIIIPERDRHNFKNSIGIVLSSGKGCKNIRTGQFVISDLVPSDVVMYDQTIPWQYDVLDTDDKMYTVDIANIHDIMARLTKD